MQLLAKEHVLAARRAGGRLTAGAATNVAGGNVDSVLASRPNAVQVLETIVTSLKVNCKLSRKLVCCAEVDRAKLAIPRTYTLLLPLHRNGSRYRLNLHAELNS